MSPSLSHLLRRSFSTSAPPAETGFLKSLTNSLYKERNLKRLVEKFKKSSEVDCFRTKTGAYEDAVRRLAAAKRFRWIEEILEDQKQYPNMSKEGFAVRLISLYGKSGMFEHASKVFEEMPRKNSARTVLSFNALLGASVNSKKFDELERIFREVPSKLSVTPDRFSYNIALKGFCEMGSFDLALSMFDEMEKNGVDPDLVTFNTLLHYLYGKNQFLDGEKVWGRMEAANVLPDIRSYNAKLGGFAVEKRMAEAVGLFEELRSKGLKPDVFSFNALIRGFCADGNLEEAKRWYNKLKVSGSAPDKVTFATLVPTACEKGDFVLAVQLCTEIFEQRCLVGAPMLQLVVDKLVNESKLEEAKRLVELGKSNKYCRYNLKMASE